MVARKHNITSWFIEITAAFLVLLFVYTGYTKLTDMGRFIGQLVHNPNLKHYRSLIAWGVPLVELVISIILIIPKTRGLGLLIGGLLMLVFTGYVAHMILTKSNLPCTCGGIISEMNWQQHLWFNSITTIAALSAWALNRHYFKAKFFTIPIS